MNIQAFNAEFPVRRLGQLNIVHLTENDRTSRELHASALQKASLIHPSLAEFVFICEEKRGDEPIEKQLTWSTVHKYLSEQMIFEHFHECLRNEQALRSWQASVVSLILVALGHPVLVALRPEKLFAVKGALPYTTPGSTEIDDRAGYLAKLDGSVPLGSVDFATVEFKKLDSSSPMQQWNRCRSLLAQTICGLSGASEIRACLAITDIGFKLLYRKEVSNDTRQVFQYFSWPEYTPSLHTCFRICSVSDPNHMQHLGELSRIIYELVKITVRFNSNMKRSIPIALTTPTKWSSTSKRVDMTAEKAKLSPPSKKSRIQSETESKENDCMQLEIVDYLDCEDIRAYDFAISKIDGTEMSMEGFSFTSDRILDSIYKYEEEFERGRV